MSWEAFSIRTQSDAPECSQCSPRGLVKERKGNLRRLSLQSGIADDRDLCLFLARIRIHAVCPTNPCNRVNPEYALRPETPSLLGHFLCTDIFCLQRRM